MSMQGWWYVHNWGLGVDSHSESVVCEVVQAAFHVHRLSNGVLFKRSFDVAADICGLNWQLLPPVLVRA